MASCQANTPTESPKWICDDPCVPHPNRSSHLDKCTERPSHSRLLMAASGQSDAGSHEMLGYKWVKASYSLTVTVILGMYFDTTERVSLKSLKSILRKRMRNPGGRCKLLHGSKNVPLYIGDTIWSGMSVRCL